MTLLADIRTAICEERLSPIFKQLELGAAGIKDENYNLSNYDKKNLGSKNSKVLVSREINREVYYAFAE